ncbi:ExbD/TolR family protein [Marinicellulosiphila megalodicopiae]|uniref:ExbD/TolR family protein n=1 Tax=Marinicellulosiphila megalodicopiae TaxID=2724896 RepID=UPI003BB1567B
MIRFRTKQREEAQVNLTPLIDVVFLLLIFFMVSTTFNKNYEQDITLPQSSSNTVQSDDKKIEIIVDASGKISVNDQTLNKNSENNLKYVLGEMSLPKDTKFYYRADQKSPIESYVLVTQTLASMGYQNLFIVTQQLQE